MCACFLRYCVFQMLKENDNVANVNNQCKLFLCISYNALSWFIEKMVICGIFLRKRRKEGFFFLINERNWKERNERNIKSRFQNCFEMVLNRFYQVRGRGQMGWNVSFPFLGVSLSQVLYGFEDWLFISFTI